MNPLFIIIAAIVLFFGGGEGLSSFLGGGDSTPQYSTQQSNTYQNSGNSTHSNNSSSYNNNSSTNQSGSYSSNSSSHNNNQNTYNDFNTQLNDWLHSMTQQYSTHQGSGSGSTYSNNSTSGNTSNSSNTGSGYTNYSESSSNAAAADTTVASGTRKKYTTIKGGGKDTNTIMVYMCGTDLESRSGMASNDLQEMANASLGNNVNIIVYTGGCKSWKIRGISNQVNQIYQIVNGNLRTLESDMGNKSMTDPATLTEFIKYCKKNFPANRNDLILWDHGGGSVSGYGYDEKKGSYAGAMNLTGISKALKDADLKFDFVGFDACLMAGAETAKAIEPYADYMIASEETEPGIGWYYTPWLNALAKNPSMDTVSIGKNIIDNFVEDCARKCRGQLTTLSIVDLAEFNKTVPTALKKFSSETADLIKNKQYKQVAVARQGSREFATSTRIDQVDLVDLARRMNTKSSDTLIKAIQGCVKYNRTSSNMTNASGLSIYFPNQKLSSVDKAVQINSAIGMDDEFNRCIKEYASLQLSGQSVAQGSGNSYSPYQTIFGGSSYSGSAGSDMTGQLLEALFGGGGSSYGFLGGRSISTEETVDYIQANQFDPSLLIWQEGNDGIPVIDLPEDQWSLLTDAAMTMWYDDGEGYVDLGCDNLFSFDEYGRLQAETDKTWLSINNQPVAYYYEETMEYGDDYTITGYVPALLNGTRVQLKLTFDQDNPYGYIAGAVVDYVEGETETIAKSDVELQAGDKLDFLCDYYDYDGNYIDSYYLGEQMTVTDNMVISNEYVGDGGVYISYRFTDIYNNQYWTAGLE